MSSYQIKLDMIGIHQEWEKNMPWETNS